MQTINVIDNIYLKNGILYAVGREEETKVFLKRSDSFRRCAVCCLMMMLIIHKKINREDLLHRVSSKAPSYIKELKKQFLLSPKRIYSLVDLQKKLLLSFNNQIRVDVFSLEKFNEEPDLNQIRKLHLMIKEHLDEGWPVQIGISLDGGQTEHSVIAVGYTMFGKKLRLFCLDSACDLQYLSLWNRVIDINMEYDNLYIYCSYYIADEDIPVSSILLIDDKQDLPFEREEIISILPF